MKLFRARTVVKAAGPLAVAVVMTATLAGSAAGAQDRGLAPDEGPGRPDYEHPGEFPGDTEPETAEASVQLTATTSDWSWPGVYESAFRIDYTVTNNGDVLLTDFRIAEENANAILHDCYNYDQPLAPGESVSCSALLFQTQNPQTVRSVVYSHTDPGSGWVTDRTSTTYTKLRVIRPPIDIDIDVDDAAGGGIR